MEITYFHQDSLTLPHRRPAMLLIHGLTGAPPELSTLGLKLHQHGFNVLLPCLSGHQTTVQELGRIRVETWISDIEAAYSKLKSVQPSRIYLGGLSFGTLLTLQLGLKHHDEISGLVLLAPLFKLRSTKKEFLLELLSYLPDSLLDSLGNYPKALRPDSLFREKRCAYSSHSIAALARAKRIKRNISKDLHSIIKPVLIAQDPQDHHLAQGSTAKLQGLLSSADIRVEFFNGAEHELTIGPRMEEVNQFVVDYLLSLEKINSFRYPDIEPE